MSTYLNNYDICHQIKYTILAFREGCNASSTELGHWVQSPNRASKDKGWFSILPQVSAYPQEGNQLA